MDKNYLDSLEGSPYVDEGLFDRVKSRGAAGIQRFKGVAGTGWTPIEEAKMESLWNSFKKKVTRLIKDFSTNVFPNIQKHRPQDILANQKSINQMIGLVRRLNPDGQNSTNLGAVSEGLGKFLRPWSLTQALSTNDTKQVITAYKAQVKKLYNEFINDVQLVTKTGDGFVGRSIVTKKPDWANLLNQIEKVAGVPISSMTGENPETPETPETPEVEEPVADAGAAPEPEAGSSASTGGSSVDQVSSNPEDKGLPAQKTLSSIIDPEVINKVIDIIIKKIEDDKKAGYTKTDYMNTSISKWRDDEKTKMPPPDPDAEELSEGDVESDVESDKKSAAAKADLEKEKGFLYRFRQEYRKHTGSFTYSLGVFDYNNKRYQALWHSFGQGERGHGHNNDIRVKVWDLENPKSASKTIVLFSFYDHEIDPREMTSEDFSINKMITTANPNIELTADESNIVERNAEKFHQALFAVTHRKSLELKTKLSEVGKKALETLISDTENPMNASIAEKYIGAAIKFYESEDKIYDAKDLVAAARAMDAKADFSPEEEQPESVKDTIKALVVLGNWNELEATQLAIKKYKELGDINITKDELTNHVLANKAMAGVGDGKKLSSLTPSPEKISTPPSEKTEVEHRLDKMNNKLSNAGLPTLDTVQQLGKLNSTKGANRLKNPGKYPDENNPKNIKLWDSMVRQAKGEVTNLNKKQLGKIGLKENSSKLSPGLINPFVRANFF
jgi:hypothetical protein